MPKKIHYKFRDKKDFDAIFSMKKSRQKKRTKNSIKDVEQKTREKENNP